MLVTVGASLSMAGPAAADNTPAPTISVAINGSTLDASGATFYTNDTVHAATATVTGDPSASDIGYFDDSGARSQPPDMNGVATFAIGTFAPSSFYEAGALQTVNSVTSSETFVAVQADVAPNLQGINDGGTYTPGDEIGVSGAIPGDDAELFVDGAKIADATADSIGSVESFVVPTPFSTDYHTASVKSVDGQGLESDGSTPAGFYVTPASPIIQSPTSAQDESSYLNSQPSITVTGVNVGATVDLYELDDQGDPGPSLASVTTAAGGTVTLNPGTPVADGFHRYVVAQTVTEGTGINAMPITSDWNSQPAAQTEVNVSTAAPELSSEVVDTPYTNSNQPRFDAHVPGVGDDALAKVRLINASTGLTLGEIGQYDSWVPSSPLADGTYSVYAVAVDDLGHVGTAHSTTIDFTVDTVAPSAPVFTSPTDGSTVTTGVPNVTVHGEAGSDMCLAIDISPDAQEGDAVCQTADGNGNATITPDTVLANGRHSLSVSSVDRAGNFSNAGATITVAIPAPVGVPPTQIPVQIPVKTPAPALTSVKLSSHSVSKGHPIKVGFMVNTPGTVTITLTKKVKTQVKIKSHGKTKTVNKTVTKIVGAVHVKITKAGPGSYTLTTTFAGHKLAHGNYTLSLKTTSAKSKSSKSVTQTLSVH